MLIWKLLGTFFCFQLAAGIVGLLFNEKLALTGREIVLSFFFLSSAQ